MKLRILTIALILIAVAALFTNRQAKVAMPQIDAEMEAAILASTVQITMFEATSAETGTRWSNNGLGTLVAYGNETLVVTHDHWPDLTEKLDNVELRDAAGHLLVTLDAGDFRALIVYQDGGVLVFLPPAALDGLVATDLGTFVTNSDTVWVARRAPATNRTTVELIPTTVTAVEETGRAAKMQMRSQDGSAIIPGDSGGGVWADGKLVANLWASGVKETRSFWNDWFGGSGLQPTDLIIAGLQPVGSQIGIDPDHSAGNNTVVESKEDLLQATLEVD